MTLKPGKFMPGEASAIQHVRWLGSQFGYGNLILHLRDAWSEFLKRDPGFDQLAADRGAGHICPWCDIDSRTGLKAGVHETQVEAIRELYRKISYKGSELLRAGNELDGSAHFDLAIELAAIVDQMEGRS